MRFLSGNDFACADQNSRRVSNLLWAAFPGRSAAEVQRRAAVFLDRDERTIRYWMEGTSHPRWHDVAMIAAALGFERAMSILFGDKG